MKKILLMMVALVATVTLYAEGKDEGMEGWISTFSPVTDKAELAGLHTAVAGDGSVYASSTYNKSFTFAEKAVTDPEGLTSSCIVKFDKDGNEKWAITLVGTCMVSAMTADAEGTLYVAGFSEDATVSVTGTDGTVKEIKNPMVDLWGDMVVASYSAFILKVSKDGVVENVLQVESAGPEGTYYGEAYVKPNKLVLSNGKLYVSCFYQGDVQKLGWEGRYITMLDFDTFETGYFGDITSAGIFSVQSADLSGLTSLASLTAKENADLLDETAIQCAPEAFSFGVKGDVVGVAFIGWGKLTLTTPTRKKNFEFKMEGEGVNEHALVMSRLDNLDYTKVHHATPYDNQGFATYNLFVERIGDNCMLGGTFFGNFPLNNEITKSENTSFLASISWSTSAVNWVQVNQAKSQATCLVVTGEEVKAATTDAVYTFETATGRMLNDDTMELSVSDACQFNGQYVSVIYTDEDKVCVFCPKMHTNTGVKSLKNTKSADAKYFNANGMELSAPRKGLNIVKTAAGVKKVMK